MALTPESALDQAGAEAIFQRTVHEVDHLVGTADQLGSTFHATLDSGYLSGAMALSPEGDSLCAAVRFVCWTGGHGGFGPVGLDGVVDVVITEDRVNVVGRLGLVEGNALVGAASADIALITEDGSTSGSVGSFEL